MNTCRLMLAVGLITLLSTWTASAEIMPVDELGAWDIIDMAGDGEVRTTRLLNAPPGFGPNVLDVAGTQILALAKGKELTNGTLLVLYREMKPKDYDGDGILSFRADYPQDISVEHNTKVMRPHVWFEQDNDSGIHFRAIGTDGKESAHGERSGEGLITDEWNITNWIWQKVEVHENGVRAKYWPAHLDEPEAWQLDEPNFMSKGTRLGFRVGSGHVQIAHYAFGIDVGAPKRRKPWLYVAQERFVTPKYIPLWLFADKDDLEESYTVESENRGRILELEITPTQTKDFGAQIVLGQSALRVLKLSGRSEIDVQGATCTFSLTQNDPLQERLASLTKNLSLFKKDSRPFIKYHYDAAAAHLVLAAEAIANDDMDRARRRLSDVEEARQELKKLTADDDDSEVSESIEVTNALSVHPLGNNRYETHLPLKLTNVISLEIVHNNEILATWQNEKKDQQLGVSQLHTFKLRPAVGHYTIRWREGAEINEKHIVAQVVKVKDAQLLVNGEPFIVKGVNVHSLDSQNPQRTRQMMQSLKGLGFNTLRGDYPPLWEVEMAEEEDLLWTILAPFSVISTEEIQYRQEGSLMLKAREIAAAHIVEYRDHPGVLLWNSCNEITGDTTAFLENLYPVYEQMDPISRRPVHYANLFGQDRWQGQDAVGINYYFGPDQTPADRQPLIQRSIELMKAQGKPVFYTEYNSYQGPIPSTAVQAIEGFFEWGLKQGMSGGFFYMGPSSDDHPGVWLDAELNIDPAVAQAFRNAYADASVSLKDARATIVNRRGFTLRNVHLAVMKDELPVETQVLSDVAPKGQSSVQLSSAMVTAHQPSTGTTLELQFTSHYGVKESVVVP